MIIPRKVSEGPVDRKVQIGHLRIFFSPKPVYLRGSEDHDKNRTGGIKEQEFGRFVVFAPTTPQSTTAEEARTLFCLARGRPQKPSKGA